MKEDGNVWALCNVIRETGFSIHSRFRHGFPERVYSNALLHRLEKQSVGVKREPSVGVFDDDGTCLGEYFPDLIIENVIVVELKAVRSLVPEHEAQLLGYLRCLRIQHGLLINFGAPRFQIRKYVLSSSEGLEDDQHWKTPR